MDLFKIFGTISIQGGDEAKKELKETSEEGEKTSSKFGKVLGGIGKGVLAVGKTIATGIGVGSVAIAKLGKDAITQYADYEQLVGGVETLFKDSSQKVQDYANVAYKTAGLSANAYMETVTSFSASLLQSLGGDTEKASETANQTIIDMADNANKMGTSMESIQNAYQGFAKQNYTMLDNLKLGYGGTKEEMERLLADATKLSGIEYDISSFADISEAIHVIQDDMGITGTTAKEASTTIQGSIGSMKSAWTNLMTGLSDPNQDLGALISNFVDSGVTAIGNIIPRITELFPRIQSAVKQLGDKVLPMIPAFVKSLLPVLVNGGVSLLTSLVSQLPAFIEILTNDLLPALISGIGEVVDGLISNLPTILENIFGSLVTLLPMIINSIVDIFNKIVSNFGTIMQPIISNLPNIIMSVVDAILSNFPIIFDGIITLVLQLVSQTDTIIQSLLDILPYIIEKLIVTLIQNLPRIIWGILQVLGAIGESILKSFGNFFVIIWDILKGVFLAICDLFRPLATWFYDNVIKPIGDFFVGIWDGIKNVFAKVGDFFKGVFDKIKSFFKLPHFTFSGSLNPFEWKEKGAPHIGVEWYAKAMDQGMIMNQPTVFGYNPQTGKAMAGGEAGSETVVGTQNLMSMIQTAVASIIENMNIDLYLDGDKLVGGTAKRMNDKLGQMAIIRRRGATV